MQYVKLSRLMQRARLKRAFGQNAAEHLELEEDFLVLRGDLTGGLKASLNFQNAAFAPLYHRTL